MAETMTLQQARDILASGQGTPEMRLAAQRVFDAARDAAGGVGEPIPVGGGAEESLLSTAASPSAAAAFGDAVASTLRSLGYGVVVEYNVDAAIPGRMVPLVKPNVRLAIRWPATGAIQYASFTDALPRLSATAVAQELHTRFQFDPDVGSVHPMAPVAVIPESPSGVTEVTAQPQPQPETHETTIESGANAVVPADSSAMGASMADQIKSYMVSTGNDPDTRRSVWDWNWFHEQVSGIVGPDPGELGFSTTEVITLDEYWRQMDAWVRNRGAGGGVDGPEGPSDIVGPPAVPAPPDTRGMDRGQRPNAFVEAVKTRGLWFLVQTLLYGAAAYQVNAAGIVTQ